MHVVGDAPEVPIGRDAGSIIGIAYLAFGPHPMSLRGGPPFGGALQWIVKSPGDLALFGITVRRYVDGD